MLSFVMDEIVAAAEIVAIEAMSITNFLYEEGEVTAEFLMEAAAWLEDALCRVVAVDF